MKCLPFKTYTVEFNRAPNWVDAGFVNGRLTTDRVEADNFSSSKTLHVYSDAPRHAARLIRRLIHSKRNCYVVSKKILARVYDIEISFYYDSIAARRFITQRPRYNHPFERVRHKFFSKQQVVRFLPVLDKKDALNEYNKIVPILKEFTVPKHEAMRIKYITEKAHTYGQLYEMHEQIVIRGRECDRCLALVDAFQDGDHAIMFRVLGFLY